jgi:SAM-dependent methyltransferase
VVGLDPWAPALELARRNVGVAGGESRVRLIQTTAEKFDHPDRFDLARLPSFFIPKSAIDDAFVRIHALLRPGGRIVVGIMFADDGEALKLTTVVGSTSWTNQTFGSQYDPRSASRSTSRVDSPRGNT